MNLSQLRSKGSQALDEMTEFILTRTSLTIYEQSGNGLYYAVRVYKVNNLDRVPFVEVDINDAGKLLEMANEV